MHTLSKWQTSAERFFEREILSVDASTLAYGTPPTAKGRYLTLMEENPELLQDVTAEILGLIPVYHSAIIKPHTAGTGGKKRMSYKLGPIRNPIDPRQGTET